MLQILENVPLKELNSFGFDIKASRFAEYTSPADIPMLISKLNGIVGNRMLILGGGCNIVFTSDFDGIVIHPINSYIRIQSENDDFCYVVAGAGTVWDEFVEWTVAHNLGGIENLSLIPGSVGAAPVQNIGAYGREAKDVIESVNIVSLTDGSVSTIGNKDCKFGYRDSIFKHEYKDLYLVDSVVFRLSKKPTFITNYGSLNSEIEKIGQLSLQTVRQAVINIRQSKLPDPKETGNAGSFFKNPTVEAATAEQLKTRFPQMVSYDAGNGRTKIAAGWMIDYCGLKGYTNPAKTAGVHNKQALVLVNLGGATGRDILDVARHVQDSVAEKFGLRIEPEAVIV